MVLGAWRGLRVRRVYRRYVFRGMSCRDLQGGGRVGVRVPGGSILGLVASCRVSWYVQHPDHGVALPWHQALLPEAVACHAADAEACLETTGHVQVELVPLVDDVVVVCGLIVVPWAVVIISNVVSFIILRTVGSTKSLPVNVLHDVLVGL